MIVSNARRPVARFPLAMLSDGHGRYLLWLSRIDVSDIGNFLMAEPFYTPLIAVRSEDQMTTVEVRLWKYVLIIFIAPRKVNWYVSKPDQETE